MSPQKSKRRNLLDGALRCITRLPAERITVRAIAAESKANMASIVYHFGSKEELITAAVIEGLDHWLGAIARELERLEADSPEERFRAAARLFETTTERHESLARNFLAALVRAQHDAPVKALLTEGFRHTRPDLAAVLRLGDDQIGEDTAGLVHAMFTGLLFQSLIEPELAIAGERRERALARLRAVLPPSPTSDRT